MTKILAVGSPKGGVGKTTQAGHLARIAAEGGRRVLLVDADANLSASDWAADWPSLDVATATGADSAYLAELRRTRRYDLIVVDLPGAREGAFRTMLAGADGRPVPHLLVVPVRPRLMDVRPVARVIAQEVQPLRLPCLVVLTQVRTSGLYLAAQRADQLRSMGFDVSPTVIRDYVAYDEAHERGRTVLELGGEKHPTARIAEREQRALASEVLERLNVRK